MEEKQVLQDMYSIRAVMSVLSSEKDKIEEIEKDNIEKENQKIVPDYSGLTKQKVSKNIICKLERLEQEEQELIETKKEHEENLKFLSENIKGYERRYYISLFVFLGLLALTIVAFSISKFVGDNYVLGIVFTIFLVISFIIAFYKLIVVRKANFDIKKYSDWIEDCKKRIKNVAKKIEKAREEYEIDVINAKESEEEYENMINEINENAKKFNKEIKKEIKSNKLVQKEIVKSSKLIYEKAIEQYGNILDERDWKYLDLIIFYLETGRADTIKEALVLVDNQVNANTIVNAIHSIGNQISQTIIKSSQFIAKEMYKDFALLSQEIENTNKNVLMASQEQNQLLRDLISETNLQNKLQEKANETSGKLANDIAYIKGLEDYKFMRS